MSVNVDVLITGIPSIVFTTPPLARVGLTEEEGHAQGRHFTIKHEDTSTWYTSRRMKSGLFNSLQREKKETQGQNRLGIEDAHLACDIGHA
ncbi:hypothetical protein KSZ_06930 [Dictyobacter formicarum]|uniref:Uncharacterized protein n=1 Tax=Dictyobacter formicarum TaxID=2778368 RepID=A0ABQ3V9X6_9CHLR|nr:hypothetical protein KSZ_06930 [Dictyobacter formicarum]